MKYDVQVKVAYFFEDIEANSKEEVIEIIEDMLQSMSAVDSNFYDFDIIGDEEENEED